MIDHYNEYNLPVYDLEKCVAFYRDKLGLELKQKEEEYAYFTFGKSDLGLALISVKIAVKLLSEAEFSNRGTRDRRAFLSVMVDDLDKEYNELVAKGVHFARRPTVYPWGQKIAFIEDPEGNLWEIYQNVES
jgi:lactoylglutathione lyase